MVVTVLLATVEIGVTHARTGCPLMCTVQAPQSDMPHPNFVPVRPSVSRRTHNSGIAGATSTVCGFPLSVNLTAAIPDPPQSATDWYEYTMQALRDCVATDLAARNAGFGARI